MYIRLMMEYKKRRLINCLVRLRKYILLLLLLLLLLLYTHAADITDLATVLQELTSNQQFNYSDWYQLGLYLGLYERTLKAIEEQSKGQLKRCLIECISSWLKGEDGVRETTGGGSNWISLVAALDTMGEREVADNIRIKYLQ